MQRPTAVVLLNNGCPVGLSAQQRGAGRTVWLTSLEDAPTPPAASLRSSGPGVRVEITSPASAVREAELAVLFVPAGTRVLPVDGKPPMADRQKTFHLNAKGSGNKLQANLLIGPSAGITRVHLLRVEYADGSTWTAPADTVCSVQPSPFVPVNAR